MPADDGIFSPHLVIQDLNDRHELGNDLFQISHGPFFQRLRQYRMVGISAGPGNHVDGFVHIQSPGSEKPDHLRNHHGGMGIIDLDHRIVRQVIEIASPGNTFIQDQLRSVADHKILLIDPQQPSVVVAVIRIQKQRQIPRDILLVKADPVRYDGFLHAVHVKEMKLVGPVFITCHFNIVHSGLQCQSPEGNRIRDIGFHKPALIFDPWIRSFLLQPVFKFLLEQPQVIIQPDPVAAHSQRGNRIQKARRKTTQSAVSERRLRLQLFDLAEVLSVFRKDIPRFLIDPQIDHVV